MTPHRLTARQIYWVPLWLSAVTGVGLIAALLGDDVWDAVSWLGLGVPSAMGTWYAFRKERG